MTELKKSKNHLQKELKQLVEDTQDLLGSTVDVADKTAKAARDKVEASLKAVKEQIEAGIADAGEIVGEQLHELDKRVRSNPYIVLGIGVGAGALLGFLVGHKK